MRRGSPGIGWVALAGESAFLFPSAAPWASSSLERRDDEGEVLVPQVVFSMPLLDQSLDLASQEAKKGVPMHRSVAVLELAGPDRLDDLVLRQPNFRRGQGSSARARSSW